MDIIDESSSEQEASIRSVDLRRELQIIKDLLRKASTGNKKKLDKTQKNNSTANLYRCLKSKVSLNKIFSTFRPGPEIFNLIIAYGKSHKIYLTIPDTLIYMPSLSFPVYLHTSKSGIVKLNYTKSSFQRFFSNSSSDSQDCSIPKYIHIAMNERIKLCYDDYEAKSAFEDCPHFSHRLHRFVRPNSLYANKLRVHWKLYNPPTAYIISSSFPFETHQKRRKSQQKLPKLNKSKSDFNQSSFIESVIEDDSVDSVKRFIVQTMANPDTNVIISNRYLPELKHSLSTITQIINSVFFRNPNKLQELLIDFIKNSDNKWVLISCKGYKIKGDQEYAVMKPQEPENDDSFFLGKSQVVMCEPVAEESGKSDISVSSSDEEEEEIERASYYIKTAANGMDKSVGKVVSKLDTKEYSELRQTDDIGRVPHLMIGVMPHKTDNPITYFIEKAKDPPIKPTKHKDRAKNLLWIEKVKINPEKYIESTSKHISYVNKIYNRYRHEAMIGKYSMAKKNLAPDLDDSNDHELSFL